MENLEIIQRPKFQGFCEQLLKIKYPKFVPNVNFTLGITFTRNIFTTFSNFIN